MRDTSSHKFLSLEDSGTNKSQAIILNEGEKKPAAEIDKVSQAISVTSEEESVIYS